MGEILSFVIGTLMGLILTCIIVHENEHDREEEFKESDNTD